jgi:hypothetical protein
MEEKVYNEERKRLIRKELLLRERLLILRNGLIIGILIILEKRKRKHN